MQRFIILSIILIAFLSFVPTSTDAGIVPCGQSENDPKSSINEALPCGFCNIFQLIPNVVNFFLFPVEHLNNNVAIVPLVAILFLVIGGIYLLIARGDPARFQQGKDILTAAITGLIIVYVAWVVLNTILAFLGVASWTGLSDNPATPDIIEGWWQIQCSTP